MSSQGPKFLDLPREIRDEIYKYLLVFDTSSLIKLKAINEPPPHDPKLASTAILRTNKQIHDEAAVVLYRCNTFYVRVTVESIVFTDLKSKDIKCTYDAVWNMRRESDYQNSLAGKTPARRDLRDRLRSFLRPAQPNKKHVSAGAQSLAQRYRHLIRRIRIDVYESIRTIPEYDVKPLPQVWFRHEMQIAILPAINWLRKSLWDGGRGIAVDINLESKYFRRYGSRRWNGSAFRREEDRPRTKEEERLCRSLVQILWPLTRISWKEMTIKTPLDARYPEVKDQELRSCDLSYLQMREEIEERYGRLYVEEKAIVDRE